MATTQAADETREHDYLTKKFAFLVADIVGSAKLSYFAGTRKAREEFYSRVKALCLLYHPHEPRLTGDGFLAVFDDLLPAVRFAISLARTMHETPITVAESSLEVRLSLHIGLATQMSTPFGENFAGSEVALAARVNSIAEPGEIVITDAVRESLPARFQGFVRQKKGKFQLKGIYGDFQVSTIDPSLFTE